MDLALEWIVPGHGPLMTPDDLHDYVAHLEDLPDQACVMHGDGQTSVEAARILIKEDRYPSLGLPERLATTFSTEFRHLDRNSEAPDLLELMDHAARIAWDRSSAGPLTP
ncbi:hypothetical protein [Streptomyces flaveolus]|uniref:hypothetical protein n=1 Tax=Streptomyces flaveolus TaxID=67297 RepID=UPI0036F58171